MEMLLEQTQKQQLIMTTELQQAIELLQFNTYELMQFIQEQADENPFLEFTDSPNYPETRLKGSSYSSQNQEADPLDFIANNQQTLHEHLLEQLKWLNLSDKDYQMMHYLILNIDERGYLILTQKELSNHFNINDEKVKQLKKVLHQLEPLGVGAENLSECLLIQAREHFPNEELLHLLIDKYLTMLADKQWNRIAKECQTTLAEVNETFRKIQTLNPRPAAEFGRPAEYVTPDIMVEYDDSQDTFHIQLSDHYIPNLHFNRVYSEQLPRSSEMNQYVNHHFRKYEWLQKSIMQRRQTIEKIMQVVLRHQKNFFTKGPRFLSPLTLKDVASQIDMHESTVSRATSNKTIETPIGTFQLRYLFSTKLTSTNGGTEQSQTTVKTMIQELIQQENKYKPLSDQKVVEQLKQKYHVEISRRTVAKYRVELRIPSSTKRKEIQVI